MSLQDQPTKEIVAIYNENADQLGEKNVKRFSTRAVAIKRTQEIVARRKARDAGETEAAPEPTPAKAEAAPKPKKEKSAKKGRVFSENMDFNMEPDLTTLPRLRAPKDKNKPSMRYHVVTMLHAGTTFAEIKAYCETRSGKTSDAIIYNRIRNINLICGYGLVHDRETGEIRLSGGQPIPAPGNAGE